MVFLLNDTFSLLSFKTGISSIISNLVLAIKKNFKKDLGLLTIFIIEKSAITISKIFQAKPSIFWTPALVFQILSFNF